MNRWAFDVISVLVERFTKFLDGTASSREINSHAVAIARDWPAWQWHLIVGDTRREGEGKYFHMYATSRRVGVFPSREEAENALHEERGALEESKGLSMEETQEVAWEVAEIEKVKRTSADVMIAIILVVDLLGIITFIVLLST